MSRGRGPVYTTDPETGSGGEYSAAGLKLLNAQPLPLAGTMFYAVTDVYYYTDKELTVKHSNPLYPDYPFRRLAGVGNGSAGVYTGQYFAINGVLKSVQVKQVSGINPEGVFGKYTEYTHWIFTDVRYDATKQGVLSPDYKYDENGLLAFNYDNVEITYKDEKGNLIPIQYFDEKGNIVKAADVKKAADEKNKNTAIFIFAGIFLLYITRKKKKK